MGSCHQPLEISKQCEKPYHQNLLSQTLAKHGNKLGIGRRGEVHSHSLQAIHPERSASSSVPTKRVYRSGLGVYGHSADRDREPSVRVKHGRAEPEVRPTFQGLKGALERRTVPLVDRERHERYEVLVRFRRLPSGAVGGEDDARSDRIVAQVAFDWEDAACQEGMLGCYYLGLRNAWRDAKTQRKTLLRRKQWHYRLVGILGEGG